MEILVSVEDLNYLTTFKCSHLPKTMCTKTDRGGICNSCWVRDWAEEQLQKSKRQSG